MTTGIAVIAEGISAVATPAADTRYTVKTPTGVYYCVFINSASDVVFSKSIDGGVTWSAAVTVFAGSVVQLSVWYDRWSNISAGLIHCAYIETDGHDTLYRSIDTELSDTLGTQTTIFDGASAAAGGALSICRARGGNIYCKTVIDAGLEGGFFRSTDVGATWGARTDSEALATTDQWILMPGWAADNQDIMMFFWDASADEISRVLYDDSGNSWAETSIATSMVDRAATGSFPHFSATVDITNSRNLLVAWSATDLSGADLRCWHITESAITEVTNVILNSTDDQGFAAIGIDTDNEDWYVFYAGKSSGVHVFNSSLGVFYKKSTDDGATWGAETMIVPPLATLTMMDTTPRFDTEKMVRVLSGSGTGSVLSAAFDVPESAGRAVLVNNNSLVA